MLERPDRMGIQQKQGSVPHPECAYLIKVKKPWMFSVWKIQVKRTDLAQLGMGYLTRIFDTIHQIGDICESCCGIISLGSLGALKYKEKPPAATQNSGQFLPVLKLIPLWISVSQSWHIINLKSTLSVAFPSTSVTKEAKFAILSDHFKPTSKANSCSLISHLEC